MQTISLYDTLTICVAPKGEPPFRLTCSDSNLATGDTNLVTKAAKFMVSKYGITHPIHIHLEKHIPIAAGLAGGSSNCAATLRGINNLFDLRIPLHTLSEQHALIKHSSLVEIGSKFGADVPFCIMGGTALAEGVGERLTQLPAHPSCWVVLACPNIPISTKSIFEKYTPPATRQDIITPMLQALKIGNVDKITQCFSNDLTNITAGIYPKINEYISEMKTQGAINAAMSGSGPSVFGYFNDKEIAIKAKERLEKIAGRAFLTEII